MTRLELVQFVARTLGTEDPDEITSTTSPATDYISDIVAAVDAAWDEIQVMHEGGWHWRREQQTFNTVASTREYTFSTINADCVGVIPMCPYADGESFILINNSKCYFIPYQNWRGYRDLDTTTEQLPRYFTVRHDGGSKIELHPTPDDAYTVKLDILHDVQELSADATVPLMPARFHRVIGLLAAQHLLEYDENQRFALVKRRYQSWLNDLREDQLPKQRFTVVPLGYRR